MPRLNQRGAIQFIVLLILLLGIVGGIFLVTRGEPLKLLPRATVSGPITPQTNMSLTYWPSDIYPGRLFTVHLRVRSDIDKANLFAGKFTFDPNVLEVDSISTDYFLQNIVEKYFDNQSGTVSVIGGVPNPGFSTTAGSEDPIMAQIMVKVKPTATSGSSTRLKFSNDSAIYRNSDNLNILGPTNGVTIPIGTATSPVPSAKPTPPPPPPPAASPSPTSVATPKLGKGDGNQNGEIDLADMSVLLSAFNKTGGFREAIDMNGDGKINTFDFSLMRNLLIQKGIIRR